MKPKFKHIELQLVSPNFDSRLMDALMELDHLRKLKLGGTTAPHLFYQLKEIFHLLESVGSARIEGNRTTVSEYIEQKIDRNEHSEDRFSEIANITKAMEYIESTIDEGSDVSHHFIRELHQLAVNGLNPNDEGDKTPGAYRSWEVSIKASSHQPPQPHLVQTYMDELIKFINFKDGQRYDLIKVAIAHHRFAWIHPFGNGNGRVVRLLTYALLIKYGFRVKQGQILNPAAVFCSDREQYYEMLSVADQGTEEAYLVWCEYVLTGICDEITKITKLLDHDYLLSNILAPAISLSVDRGLINKDEEKVLRKGVEQQYFKSGDITKVLPALSTRQRTHLIKKLKDNNMIQPLKEGGREYVINFTSSYLIRGLIKVLEEEAFIPEINS